MNNNPSPDPRSDSPALVLGGGGSTGNAWLIGVLAGLAEAGLRLTDADPVIGTSAGATAAAQIAWSDPAELYAAILAAPVPQRPAPGRPVPGPVPAAAVSEQLQRTDRLIAAAQDLADYRRRLGASALELPGSSDPNRSTRWREIVAARLPGTEWPPHRLLLTAIDARTGEPVVFDADSGVALVDAVAASCSSGMPYRLGGSDYLDGGYRRNENADLAAGHPRVLVLSPFGGRSRTPAGWGQQLEAQVAELRGSGSAVETVFPDAGSEHLFGAAAMDLSQRPAAARAGHALGLGLAEQLAEFWG